LESLRGRLMMGRDKMPTPNEGKETRGGGWKRHLKAHRSDKKTLRTEAQEQSNGRRQGVRLGPIGEVRGGNDRGLGEENTEKEPEKSSVSVRAD